MIKKIISGIIPRNKLNQVIEARLEQELRNNKFIPIGETQQQDVFIAGFPKSGNTWMQNLVCGLLFGISTEFLPDRLTQELVPDVHYKKYYKRFLTFNCFKTHDLPKSQHKRVIHLVRDPRDVLVSYYHYLHNLGQKKEYSEMICLNSGELYQWKKHFKEWSDNRFNAEIIVLRYEDLINNPLLEMRRVTQFLMLERSDEVLEKAIKGNSFEIMTRKEDSLGFDNDVSREIWNPAEKFFRKGKIGSYKEELSKEFIEVVDNETLVERKILGYV